MRWTEGASGGGGDLHWCTVVGRRDGRCYPWQDLGGVVKVGDLAWPDTVNLLLAGKPARTLVKIVDRVK